MISRAPRVAAGIGAGLLGVMLVGFSAGPWAAEAWSLHGAVRLLVLSVGVVAIAASAMLSRPLVAPLARRARASAEHRVSEAAASSDGARGAADPAVALRVGLGDVLSLRSLAAGSQASDDAELLRAAGIVDEVWYRRVTGCDAADVVAHWFGLTEPRPPVNRDFDRSWYRLHYGLSDDEVPELHYLRVGWRSGCRPAAWIDLDEVRESLLLPGAVEPLGAMTVARMHGAGALYRAVRAATGQRWTERELLWADRLTDAPRRCHGYALYRIVGNDLPPRHRDGQSVSNVRFILEHEAHFADVDKWFVLNRIVDQDVEAGLVELLEQHGANYLRIPFDGVELAERGWSTEGLPRPGVNYQAWFWRADAVQRAMLLDHLYHAKNLYLMNNNGARNLALEHGRSRAQWVLPFDGNCFFTESAWSRLRADVEARPHIPHVLVPMARVRDNRELLDPTAAPPAREEPQVGFRHDAPLHFDPQRRYGRRPKVSLLCELGVPGPWDTWRDEPWERPKPPPGPFHGSYHTAGWVARLTSGQARLESDDRARRLVRMAAIRSKIEGVDQQVLAERLQQRDWLLRDPEQLARLRSQLRPGGSIDQVLHRALGRADRDLDGLICCVLAASLRADAELAAEAYERAVGQLAGCGSSRRAARSLDRVDELLDAVRILTRSWPDRIGLEGRAAAWAHRYLELTQPRRWSRQIADARLAEELGRAAAGAFLGDGATTQAGLVRLASMLADLAREGSTERARSPQRRPPAGHRAVALARRLRYQLDARGDDRYLSEAGGDQTPAERLLWFGLPTTEGSSDR